MATITSAGIGSGIDVESLIQRLMTLERTPIDQLKTRTDGLKTQLSAVGKIQSSLSSLRDAANRLSRTDTFRAASTAVGDATVASATAGSTATPGSYSLEVERLAKAQSVVSTAVPTGSNIGTGTLTIEFGRYSDDLSQFDADPSRTSLVIPVVTGDDQLNKIRDQINAMKRGIVANVVSDVNGSRLVMRAADSGAANAFRITATDDDGNPADANGLSRLAFDRTTTTPVNPGSLGQAAQNSVAYLDGVRVESASNRIDSAIEGVTVNLTKATAVGTPTTVTVSQDRAAVKKAVTDFVASYNDTLKLLRDQTRNDPNGGTGPLRGDSGVIGIQNQLRNLMGSSTTLGGSLSRLAEIGLDPASDGSLKITDTKLETALDKVDDLKNLFSGIDNATSSNSGFAVRLRTLADDMLGIDGRIGSKQKGIQSRIDANDDRSEQLERRLTLVEKRLRSQYTALDGTMGKATNLSNYLTQQLAKLG